MDVARMITDAAVELYKKECNEHAVSIEISMMMGRYVADIQFISMTHAIIIRYKVMEFKVLRASINDFEYICNFILDQIINEMFMVFVGEDIDDDIPEYNIIGMKRNNEMIFQKNVNFSNFKEKTLEYIMPLRLMN